MYWTKAATFAFAAALATPALAEAPSTTSNAPQQQQAKRDSRFSRLRLGLAGNTPKRARGFGQEIDKRQLLEDLLSSLREFLRPQRTHGHACFRGPLRFLL